MIDSEPADADRRFVYDPRLYAEEGVPFARLAALLALVGAAAIVYFGIAFAVGAIDRQRIATLTKRAK